MLKVAVQKYQGQTWKKKDIISKQLCYYSKIYTNKYWN